LHENFIPELIEFSDKFIDDSLNSFEPVIYLFTEEESALYIDVFAEAAKLLKG